MANPTTNFGWVMPTATDLVTDLPADFNTFGQGVDTTMAELKGGTTGQILSKTSATDMDFTWTTPNPGDITEVTAGTGISGGGTSGGVTVSIDTTVTVDKTTAQTLTNKTLTSPALTTPTISTATTNGDLLYGTGSGALSRLGIGSSAQVLTVAGGIPSWAAAPTSSTSFTLLNSGGTALSGASTSVTVASYDKYYVVIPSGKTGTANCEITLVINSDTSANYPLLSYNWGNTYIDTLTSALVSPKSGINMLQTPNSTSEPFNYICEIYGGTSTGIKPFNSIATVGNTGRIPRLSKGYYKGTSAITNIAVYTSLGSFNEGSIYIYGSN